MLRMLLCLSIAATLVGCAASPGAPGALGMMTSGLITRQFAGPETYLGPMPTAVILLRRNQSDRNSMFCNEYLGRSGLVQAANQGGLAANMLLTRWPLAAPALESTPTQCDRMLMNYDFSRAEALIQAFSKEEGSTLGQVGPHVLVLYPDGGAIIADGSNVPTAELGQWSAGWVGALRPPSAAPVASAAQQTGASRSSGAGTASPATQQAAAAGATRQENVSVWERMRRTAYNTLRGLGGVYGEAIMGALSWAFAPVPSGNG